MKRGFRLLQFLSTAIGLCLLAKGASGAVLKSVQTGTQTMGVAITNVNLATPVIATNAFVICQADTGAVGSAPTVRATCELNSNTQLTITTNVADATLTVRWYVAEFLSGVSVQRNLATLPIGTNTLAVPVALVTLASSFVLVTERMNSATQTIDEEWTVRAQLTTGTNLKLDRNGGATTAVSVAWQVIQIDSAAVQSGTATIAVGATFATFNLNTLLNPPVDTSRTFLVFSRSAGSATGGEERRYQVTGQITLPNQITFTRWFQDGAANTQVNIVWYAVRMTDGTTVQNNVCGPSGKAPATMPNTPVGCLTIPKVIATNRSIALLSTLGLGDTIPINLTADLDDTSWRSTLAPNAITLDRSTGASLSSNATIAWQVVQFNNTTNTIDRVEVVP